MLNNCGFLSIIHHAQRAHNSTDHTPLQGSSRPTPDINRFCSMHLPMGHHANKQHSLPLSEARLLGTRGFRGRNSLSKDDFRTHCGSVMLSLSRSACSWIHKRMQGIRGIARNCTGSLRSPERRRVAHGPQCVSLHTCPRSHCTRSLGWAPTPTQYRTLSTLKVTSFTPLLLGIGL